MTPQTRKTLGLSLAVLALAFVHFFFAYQFIVTSHGGFNVGAVIFGSLGILQAGLGALGIVAALRRR